MALTDSIASFALDQTHVPAAQRLSEEAHWNQVPADWRLMLRHGHAIGMKAGNDLVASALALPFGPTAAWISMVLVTAAQRRKGLASRLVADCLEWLASRGNEAALDATTDGAKVYRPLGFETVREMTRWHHPGGAILKDAPALRPMTASDIAWAAPLDEAVFGAPRGFVLEDFLARGDCPALALPACDGFAMARTGRNAVLIGPLVAPDDAAAIGLLHGLMARLDSPVFIDAFDDQTGLTAELRRLGFREQRSFERMVRGNTKHFGDPARYFAAAGPELG